jgi:hypothetical protein
MRLALAKRPAAKSAMGTADFDVVDNRDRETAAIAQARLTAIEAPSDKKPKPEETSARVTA